MAHVSSPSVAGPSPRQWYRGDLHSHTTCSDGYHPPRDLLALARAEGLDFLAITDHNSVDAFGEIDGEPGPFILPGIEVTLEQGHFNVFGLAGRYAWLEPLRADQYRARLDGTYASTTLLLREVARLGLLSSINHPYLVPWEWRDPDTAMEAVHCLEIWNDPSWPDNEAANPQAVAFWTAALNAGYRITAVGGSDYHRPAPLPGQQKPAERLGLPRTYVYAEELSVPALLAALRERRVYVSMGVEVAFGATVNGVTYGIGADLGTQEGTIELAGAVLSGPEGVRARLVKNGECLAEAVVGEGEVLHYRERLDPLGSSWYRLDVVDRAGRFLAMTNPIFAGPATRPALRTFGELRLE